MRIEKYKLLPPAVILLGLIIAFARFHNMPIQPGTAPPQPAAKNGGATQLPPEELSKEFTETAERFITVLESGDPMDFVDFCDPNGVVFEVDADPISFANIQKAMKHRTGLYCALFDTACERRLWPQAKNVYSTRDLLTKAHSKKVETVIDYKKNVNISEGYLRITIENGEQIQDNGMFHMDYQFEYINKKWKLVVVDEH